MTTATALETAIKFEEEGVKLYTDLLRKADNELSKKLFISLIEQEKEHITFISDFAKNKQFKSYNYKPLTTIMKYAFEETKKAGQQQKGTSIKEGYEQSLRVEDKGYKMYQKALGSSTDAEEKKFFKFLMDMEKEHYESLANVYNYLVDNDKWLALNESTTWNWMNF